MTTLFWLIGAFVLYMFVLPLFGLIIGFFLRMIAPYVLGAFALIIPITELVTVAIALLWASAVWTNRQILMRRKQHSFPWYEGHCQAVADILNLSKLRTAQPS